MAKQMKHNKGFSLIELLIAITILSIVMVMIGQFMSSSTAAYKKTKNNLNVQSEAMNVITSISDTISQANYVRVAVADNSAYIIEDTSGGTATASRTRKVKSSTVDLTSDRGATVDYDFVSDDYPNHVRDVDTTTERKIIINFDDYTFKPPMVADDPYPQSGDLETGTQDVRSFRALRKGTDYYYVEPKYIYFEYQDIDNPSNVNCVAYRVDVDNSSIYLYRKSLPVKTVDRYQTITAAVEALCAANSMEGLLTSSIKDFYLTADVEGNAIMLNALFEKRGGYQYNSIETIKFRNTNAITVRPQKLYKEKGTGNGGAGGAGGAGGGGGGGTPSEESSDEGT